MDQSFKEEIILGFSFLSSLYWITLIFHHFLQIPRIPNRGSNCKRHALETNREIVCWKTPSPDYPSIPINIL
jgi:hypothetical protein